MKLNRHLGKLTPVLMIIGLMACDDNDQWVMGDIPGKNQTAAYSNKMSAPIGGNELVLHYSDSSFIGKEVRFGRDNEGKGLLTLCGILPGEPEYTVKDIVLNPVKNSYVFEGRATGMLGTTFSYKGKVEEKKLTLDLTEVVMPENPLAGNWYTVPNTGEDTDSVRYIDNRLIYWYTSCNTIYAKVGMFTDEDGEALWDPEKIPSIVPLAFELALKPVLSCIIGSVLKEVSFLPDGNITAVYAGLPDTLGFMQMMGGQGIVRNADDWKRSPLNLASWSMSDDTTMCILPHVDMLLRQIQMNKVAETKAGIPSGGVIGGALDIYALLNKWSTTGIKLIVKKNDSGKYSLTAENEYKKYVGDYVVYIDKSEVEALFAVIDIIKAFVPAEMANMPLDELLLAKGINVEQAIRDAAGDLGELVVQMVMPLLHKFTIDNLLTQIKADLDEDPLQLGIWLSKEQISVE